MKKQILLLVTLLNVSFQAMAADDLLPEGATKEKYESIGAATHIKRGEITVESGNRITYYDIEHKAVLRGTYKIENDELHAVLDGVVQVFLVGSVKVHVVLSTDLSRVSPDDLQSERGVEVMLDSTTTNSVSGTDHESKPVIFKHIAPKGE